MRSILVFFCKQTKFHVNIYLKCLALIAQLLAVQSHEGLNIKVVEFIKYHLVRMNLKQGGEIN